MTTDSAKDDAPITLTTLREIKQRGEKFTCLTAYDASFASILEDAGVEVLLVGDSLGNVIQGHDTTLPVTLVDMIYHARCVNRGRRRALVMVDMPFMSDAAPAQALSNAARLIKEGGAHIVKLEGGEVMADTIRLLSERGIPVCAHLGLLPQSIRKMGGYRVQGRDTQSADKILADAGLLVEAGADMVLLECVPAGLAEKITRAVDVPVIGIGAGPACDAQVLVLYDMLGITPGKPAKFVRNFLHGNAGVREAVTAYVKAVKSGEYPGPEHSFT
jgi:3-methyl-2-oxobutanoate hydroxymethyltransferase